MDVVTNISKKLHRNRKWLFALAMATFFYASANDKAYDLAKKHSLKRERLKALNALKKAYDSTKSKKQKKFYKDKIHFFSEMFYSSKAQQKYEFAKKYIIEDPEQAIDRLQDAIKLEPNNIRLFLAVAEASIYDNECKDALNWISGAEDLNPYSERVYFQKAQALACLGELHNTEKEVFHSKIKKEYLYTAKLQSFFKAGKYELASQWIAKNNLNTDFPEWYYWKYQIFSKSGEDIQKPLDKYRELCKKKKSLSKKYPLEKRLCVQMKEIDEKFPKVKTKTVEL